MLMIISGTFQLSYMGGTELSLITINCFGYTESAVPGSFLVFFAEMDTLPGYSI